MSISWNIPLVILSVLIAIVGSFASLDHAQRMRDEAGSIMARLWWLAGSLILGMTLWGMHFVGLLAINLPIPVSYDLNLTLLSIVPALVGAMVCFSVHKKRLSSGRLLWIGFFVGLCIDAMHHIGLATLKLSHPVDNDMRWIILSLVLAIVASCLIIFLINQGERIKLSQLLRYMLGAILMGILISATHYSAMLGISLQPDIVSLGNSLNMAQSSLVVLISLGSMLIFGGSFFLILFNQRVAHQDAQVLAGLVLAFSLMLTYQLWNIAQQNAVHLQQVEFDAQARSIVDDINKHMNTYKQLLRSVDGMFSQRNANVSRTIFHDHIASLKLAESYPGVQSIRFVRRVTKAEKSSYIAAMHKEGIADYAIWPEGSPREVYAPVTYAEPVNERNRKTLGFDMFSDRDFSVPGDAVPGQRLTALEQARDIGDFAISGKVRLVSESDDHPQFGFVMILPVYQYGASRDTVSARSTHLVGWVVSAFSTSDLFAGMLGSRKNRFDIEIFDGVETGGKAMIYDTDPITPHPYPRFQNFHRINIADHVWTVGIHSLPDFDTQIDLNQPHTIAGSGIFISLLLTLFTWFLVRGRLRALQTTELLSQELRERKQTEQALHESEGKLRLLLDSTEEAIFGIDIQGNCTFVNRACMQMLLYLYSDELIGKNMHSLLHSKHPDGRNFPEEESRIFQALLHQTSAHVDDEVFWRADGSRLPVEYWSYPQFHEGEIVGAVVTFLDISERKKANEKLLKLSKAIESSPVSVVITDTKGLIEYINPRFTEVTGYTAQEAIGQNQRILKAGTLSQKYYEHMWQTILAGEVWKGEFHNRKKTGETYFEAATITPIRDDEGIVSHFVAVKDDITERKHTLQELKKSRDAADAANRAKSDFLANMSHEIRTPMNAIIGFSHLCLQSDLQPIQRDYLEKVYRSSNSLLNIINDILDFSKVEAGKLELEAVPFNLDEVLRNVFDVTAKSAVDKGLKLLVNSGLQIPQVLVGDPLRLGQILRNLVGNAIKFTEAGEVSIQVNLESQTPEHIVLVFSVRDTGIGLTPEQVKRIFVSFSQADASTTRKYGGTGLGLSISKQFVELMGGKMWVESTQGEGSTFAFNLPFNYPDEKSSESSELYRHSSSLEKGERADLSGLRVLLVEDNEFNQQLGMTLLTNAGIEVMLASDGEEAVQKVEPGLFDAVLMDLQMPKMDGFEATQAIRKNPQLADLPIIAMTANVMKGDRERCVQAGMNDYISKPINVEVMYATLSRYTGRQVQSIVPERPIMVDAEPAESIFDTDKAIENMGSQATYLIVLDRFTPFQSGVVSAIQESLAANDRKSAIRQAHTLKGIAATIGADVLAEAANQLEKCLRDENNENYPSMIVDVETELTRVIPLVEAYIRQNETAEPPTPPVDKLELATLITKLAEQLQSYDSDAADTMLKINQKVKGSEIEADFARLNQHMKIYDFENALEEVLRLASVNK